MGHWPCCCGNNCDGCNDCTIALRLTGFAPDACSGGSIVNTDYELTYSETVDGVCKFTAEETFVAACGGSTDLTISITLEIDGDDLSVTVLEKIGTTEYCTHNYSTTVSPSPSSCTDYADISFLYDSTSNPGGTCRLDASSSAVQTVYVVCEEQDEDDLDPPDECSGCGALNGGLEVDLDGLDAGGPGTGSLDGTYTLSTVNAADCHFNYEPAGPDTGIVANTAVWDGVTGCDSTTGNTTTELDVYIREVDASTNLITLYLKLASASLDNRAECDPGVGWAGSDFVFKYQGIMPSATCCDEDVVTELALVNPGRTMKTSDNGEFFVWDVFAPGATVTFTVKASLLPC